MFLIEPDVKKLLSFLDSYLSEHQVRAYLVGGFVRDHLLSRKTKDIDIAIEADALKIADEFASAFNGTYVLLDKTNGIARVVLEESGTRWNVDFSTIHKSINDDMARRDFTFDAIAVELSGLVKHSAEPSFIDPFAGQKDLEQYIIRAVKPSVFEDDAIRLLRAVRLAAELGFTIESATEALIQKHSNLISGIATERVREELLKIFSASGKTDLMFYLDNLGLISAIFPELALSKGIEQPKEHFWNVFDHSIRTPMAVDFLLRRGDWLSKADGMKLSPDEILASVPWSQNFEQHFNSEVNEGSTRRALLKLAALLHDIAKPQTKAKDETGRTRFLGHPYEGAAIAVSILERLRFSSKEIRLVECMVANHMRPTQLSHEGEMPTDRAIYRYFRDTEDTGIDILFLSLADHMATRGPTLELEGWQEHTRITDYVLSQRFEHKTTVIPEKIIDGHDIIKIFSLTPGPEIGKILEFVREAQASREIATREEAISLIREHLMSKAAN